MLRNASVPLLRNYTEEEEEEEEEEERGRPQTSSISKPTQMHSTTTACLPVRTVLSFLCFLLLIDFALGQQQQQQQHVIRRARKIVATDIGHVNLPSYVRDDAMKVLDEGADSEDNDIIPPLPENAGVSVDRQVQCHFCFWPVS
nr:unnamed protein product [Spirometra erinaceieuropaei]